MTVAETFDAIVIGAGMAGLTAASYLAARGGKVVVIEKSPAIGGSALISGGIVWTPESVQTYRNHDQTSNESLIQLSVQSIEQGLEWMHSLGVEVSAPFRLDHVLRFDSIGRRFDNHAYLHRCKAYVEKTGGHILTQTTVKELITEEGTVTGAILTDRDGESEIRSNWTVLATGGFQGNPELRRRYLGEGTTDIVLRANRYSDGGGLQLGVTVGADVVSDTDRFYGNLLPVGMGRAFEDRDYLRLSQYHSIHSLLLDRDGHRLGDESIAYYENAMLVSRIPDGRALLVGDERVRDLGKEVNESVDRVSEAAGEGCRVATGVDLEELESNVKPWGYENVARSVHEFNDQITTAAAELNPPRTHNRAALTHAPYFALEVQPGITFPFAGLHIDDNTRVLDTAGIPIPGLLSAGVDTHVFHHIYGGGLGYSLATGMRAAEVVAESL